MRDAENRVIHRIATSVGIAGIRGPPLLQQLRLRLHASAERFKPHRPGASVPDKTDLVLDLAKRRGFLWPAFEAYGGAAGFYDYGPLGAVMKKRLEDLWRRIFVQEEQTPMVEIFCPRVTPEAVLVASGHVGEFTDLLVKCQACQTPLRADHLVAAAGFEGNAGSLKAPDVDRELASRKPKCPQCGKAAGYSPAVRQNLMNQTEIGPGSGRVGYLRPETAQGIFVDFPFLSRYFRGQLPFGVVQLGGSNRNEISPRQGMLRLREFSMMECEVFYDPARKTHPRFGEVADRKATFVRNTDEKPREDTFGHAVKSGMVANEALAYWLARTQEFLVAAGMDPKRLHFRQHLTDEMAHYAADCWDAEFLSDRYGWVECVGVADRGTYDLRQHAKHSGKDNEFRITVPLPHPIPIPAARREPNLTVLGKALKAQAKEVAAQMEREFQAAALGAYQKATGDKDGTVTFTIAMADGTAPKDAGTPGKDIEMDLGGQTVAVPAGSYTERPGLHITEVRRFANVIEPSFGVDRILYALWEHSYEAGTKNDEAYTRFRLSRHVAPVQVAVLPLTGKDTLPDQAHKVEWDLRREGFLTDSDDAGSIGRRYARQDEVGTPFCVTIDNETSNDGKVTIRHRDTGAQDRVSISGLVPALRSLLA
jgi:glycyl-tRNA synthetase